MHLSDSQKRIIAKNKAQGQSAAYLTYHYGVSVATIYNVCRKAGPTPKGPKTVDKRELMATPKIKPDDLPDDIEELKRRRIELQKANAQLEMDETSWLRRSS